jgi:MFS transporter, FSR family, fosmidomycin resistance protein
MATPRARAVLTTGCAIHFLHDGFTDLLYVLFPIWARELSLSFAEVGLLKTGFSGALALFQVPAGLLAERWGELRVLAGGTLITGLGFLLVGTAGGFGTLLVFLILGGLGSGTQHPLSSSLVSREYEEGRRRVALGTYNFSGDLGKTTWPAIVALVSASAGWRWATEGIGVVGLAAACCLFAIRGSVPTTAGRSASGSTARASGWGIRDAHGFRILSTIHGIDNGSRTAFMTYLPFLLLGKGAGMDLVGVALGLTFAGGAVGKFVCGAVAERLGIIRTVVITEAATGLGVFLVVALPLYPVLFVLPRFSTGRWRSW